jgi:FixJ family two-component response regulator
MLSKEIQLVTDSAAHPASVFVIDDDLAVRESLGKLIRSVGLKVGIYASPDEFLAQGQWARPGCIVLDVRLPGKSGLAFQEELARAHGSMPIIFITGHSDIPMSVRAMKAGAVEFMTKPVRPQDLLDAIQVAITRDVALLDQAKATAQLKAAVSTLTTREKEVFDFVVAGLINKQIAATLGISEATVKLHRGNVMQKMHAESVADLVRMADRLAT